MGNAAGSTAGAGVGSIAGSTVGAGAGDAVGSAAGAGAGGTAGTPFPSSFSPQQFLTIAAIIWLAGLTVLLLYSLLSWWKLYRITRTAIRCQAGVYECEAIPSPFVLGIFRPKIYLPPHLVGKERKMILCHERVHIKRKDSAVKMLAFALTALHWFNPLIWLAFFSMGRDMEMSCDEQVLMELGSGIRKDYSLSILSFARQSRRNPAGPLAFGESDAGKRIKNVLRFKRPRALAAVCGFAAAAVLAVVCLTNGQGFGQQNAEDALTAEASEESGTAAEEADSLTAEEPGTLETEAAAMAEGEAQAPTKEEVLAMREAALAGMEESARERLTENIKVANLTLEQAWFYDDLFSRLSDPDDLYWNYIDQRGEIQIGWAFEDGVTYETMGEGMSREEFNEKYGSKVLAYNRIDGDAFISLMTEMKESMETQLLDGDFDLLTENMRLAMETHDAAYVEQIYRIVHDMDYFLLRYGPEDVGKYTQDKGTVGRYYGALQIYSGEAREALMPEQVMERVFQNSWPDKVLSFGEPYSPEDGDALMLLARTEDGRYKAYGCISPEYGCRGIFADYVIDGEDNINYLDVPWENQYDPPTMNAADYDGDGREEAALVYLSGSGTGVSVQDLIVFETYETGHMEPWRLTQEQIREEAERLIEVQVRSKEGMVDLYNKESGEIILQDLNYRDYNPAAEFVEMDYTSRIHFEAKGGIYVYVGVGLMTDTTAAPVFPDGDSGGEDSLAENASGKNVAFRVDYEEGKFTLADPAYGVYGASYEKQTKFDEGAVLVPLDGIASVKIINGSTGKVTILTDGENFEKILRAYEALDFEPDEKLEKRVGYTYSCTFYDKNGSLLQQVTPYKDAVMLDSDIYSGTANHTTTDLLLALSDAAG